MNSVNKVVLSLAALFFIKCSSFEDTVDTYKEYPYLSSYKDNCISLVDSCIIALYNSRLCLSTNLGESWIEGPNVPEEEFIRMAYLFEDGTLFFCTDEDCYYSVDYKNIDKSIIYDVDGKPFDKEGFKHTFSAYEHDGFRAKVNNKELLCWGGYNNEDKGFKPRLWMTSDSGRTVRCTYKFGEKGQLKARHVHAVNFNESDYSFWAQTGDFTGQCHWLQGFYNDQTDNIEWSLIGSGPEYKTGNMQFFDGWIYASKDSSPGGVFRVQYENAKRLSEYKETLFSTPNDCLSVYISKNGGILLIMTTTGGGYNPQNIFYSIDRSSFTEIKVSLPDSLKAYGRSIFYNTWGVTSDGYVLTGIRTKGKAPLSRWDLTPSVWLNENVSLYTK